MRKDVSLNRLPVLILTAKGEEADRVVGLELGADDYVTKPFSPRELVARVKALLRRAEPSTPAEKPIEIGALRIDPAAYRVTRGGKPVPMTRSNFACYFLAARPNRVFTRDQLLDGVWGTERFVTPRSVDVYVRRLREKVEVDPQRPVYMKTIRGAGYLFEPVRARLFWKLGLAYFALLLGVLFAAYLYSSRVLQRDYVRFAGDNLASLTSLAQARPPRLDDAAELRAWTEWMATSGARVTVIDNMGRVLTDSAHDPATMENQSNRPEIQQAFASGKDNRFGAVQRSVATSCIGPCVTSRRPALR